MRGKKKCRGVVFEADALSRGSLGASFLPVLISALPRQPATSVSSRSRTKYLGLGPVSLLLARSRLGLEVSASILLEERNELWLQLFHGSVVHLVHLANEFSD